MSRVVAYSFCDFGDVQASLRYGFRIFPNTQSQTRKYGEQTLPSPPFPKLLAFSIILIFNTKMKKFLSLMFWLGLCLTIIILCDSCNVTARKYKVGQKIVLRGTDTVQVIQVIKGKIKVRYTRKNGSYYEYQIKKEGQEK